MKNPSQLLPLKVTNMLYSLINSISNHLNGTSSEVVPITPCHGQLISIGGYNIVLLIKKRKTLKCRLILVLNLGSERRKSAIIC